MSIFEKVPLRTKGCRYFLQAGPTTKFNRGWRTRAEVDAWLTELRPFWRAGYMFDTGEVGVPTCRVVKRNGQELKP